MSRQQVRGLIQVLFLVGFVLILIRFFPVVARAGQMAAFGLREFWWLVLTLSLGGWLIWVLGKRNSG